MAQPTRHPSTRSRVVIAITLALAVTGTLVSAQTIRSTLTGAVTDPNGAVVTGVLVTATNVATNIATTTKTNNDGLYAFTALTPGEYVLAVEQKGFKRFVQSGIVLQIAQATRLDVPLEVGQITEEVSVVGEAQLVRSTSSELGQVIDYKQIQSLPLNGRLFQQLVTLTPGAVARGFADFAENPAAAGARSFVHHSVNGMPWSGNNYLLDGVANNEPLNAFINVTPPLEAIQEFKVQTNNPSAEFGVFGGAVVNLTIRSGTNRLSGSVFEYYRDDSLNARNFFAATKAPFNSHQFGGTVGGPIQKNRAFFFGDFQGLRQDQGRTFLFTVPTAEMRTGNLSGISNAIFDPATGERFAGNIIPAGRINPIARRAADVWPLPNNGTGLVNNYLENNVQTNDLNAFDVRGDVTLGRAGALFVRYSRAHRDFVEPPAGNQFMEGGNASESSNYNAVGGHTYTLSGSMLNELRVGINKFDLAQFGSDFGIPKNNELGIPNGNIEGHPYTFGIADFNIPGYRRTGSPGFTNSVRIGTTVQLSDTLSWLVGRHSVKVGGDYRHITSTLTNPQTMPRGRFTFGSQYTSNAGASGTGDAFASFLLGFPNQIDRDFVDTYPNVLIHFVGFFAQDDFRVTRNLTMNLGLRWDLLTSPVEKANRQTNFSLQDGLIHLASKDDRGPLTSNFYGGWAPRLGVAYSPDDGRTAIRAAFGISYYRDNFGANGGTLERNHPLFQQILLQSPTQFTPVPQPERWTSGVHAGAVDRDHPTTSGVCRVLLPGRGQAEPGADVQRRHPAAAPMGCGRRCDVCRHARLEHLSQPQHQRAAPRPRRARPATAVLQRGAEHAVDQPAIRRRQIVVRRAAGQVGQALLWWIAGAGVLYVFEERGYDVHPASLVRHESAFDRQGDRHPQQSGRQLDVRAAVRAGEAVRQRRFGDCAETARRMGGERHHHVSDRRAAQRDRRIVAAQYRKRELGERHLH